MDISYTEQIYVTFKICNVICGFLPNACAASDYITIAEDSGGSRIFTVFFQSKQSNSSEHIIQIAHDNIFEGKEYIHCRIAKIRFTGQAAQLFRAQEGVTNTSVDVGIEDDDSKQINTSAVHIKCRIAL